MRKISTVAELKASIAELELKTKQQEQALKENAKSAVRSIRPGNLLRLGINKLATTPDIRRTAINTFVGLAAGYITRKFVVGKSKNIFKRTLGAAVQAGITRLVHKKLPGLQQKTTKLISKKSRLRRGDHL